MAPPHLNRMLLFDKSKDIMLGCGRLSDSPEASDYLKDRNCKIGHCEACKTEIWITDKKRALVKKFGENRVQVVCLICAAIYAKATSLAKDDIKNMDIDDADKLINQRNQ